MDHRRADAEHDHRRDPGQELDEREVGGDQSLSGDSGVEVFGPEPVKARVGQRLVDERLGLAHAREALLEVGVDDRDPVARLVVEHDRATAEGDGRERQRDHHAERAQPEREVDHQQRGPDSEERDQGDERRQRAVLDQ